MAPVVLELQRRGVFRVITCLTGQHREMLDQVIEAFSLPVDHDLKIMRERQSLGHITSAVLSGIDPLLEAAKPDLVMVHGDTTTTFAAALAAYYRMIPVAHVEAGLRTDNIYSPYPEEMNRRLADRLAEIHYAPTTAARDALLREGAAPEGILVTGNTVIDALLATAATAPPAWERRVASRPRPARTEGPGDRPPAGELGDAHGTGGPGHQAGVRADAGGHLHLPHPPQPGGAEDLPGRSRRSAAGGLHRAAPLPAFVHLMKAVDVVITDSGGHPGGSAHARQAGPGHARHHRAARGDRGGHRPAGGHGQRRPSRGNSLLLLTDPERYRAMATAVNPYGDGRAAERIADHLEFHFGLRPEPPAPFA